MEIPGGTIGVQQLAFLKAEGVNPKRLIVGHVDERPDIDVLSALADEGCFIQFDVIGKENWLLDQTRAELVHALIERGYLTHLLLSQDRNRHHEMRYSGNTGYCHIFETFLPRLQRLGVTDEQIEMMMVHNPARALDAGVNDARSSKRRRCEPTNVDGDHSDIGNRSQRTAGKNQGRRDAWPTPQAIVRRVESGVSWAVFDSRPTHP